MIVCPKCGNNCCSGGSGELPDGSKCDICELAYQYQELAWNTNSQPKETGDEPKFGWDEISDKDFNDFLYQIN